jgi:hypothetical protein
MAKVDDAPKPFNFQEKDREAAKLLLLALKLQLSGTPD